MNTDEFNISSALGGAIENRFVTINTDKFVPAAVDTFARETVGEHYLLAAGVIVLLALFVVYMLVFKGEGFNPTTSMRMQDSDQFGRRENLAAAPTRADSVFAQQVQTNGGTQVSGNLGSASDKNSMSYAVLNSADFDCNNRKPSGDNAWDWMNGVAHENAVGKPTNDNDFSKVLAGQ